jgi:hypothetical protein
VNNIRSADHDPTERTPDVDLLVASLHAETKRRQALEQRIDELIPQLTAANEQCAALAAGIQRVRLELLGMLPLIREWAGCTNAAVVEHWLERAITDPSAILAARDRQAKREALVVQRERITGVKMPDSYHHGLQALAFHRGVHAALDVVDAALAALDAEEKTS